MTWISRFYLQEMFILFWSSLQTSQFPFWSFLLQLLTCEAFLEKAFSVHQKYLHSGRFRFVWEHEEILFSIDSTYLFLRKCELASEFGILLRLHSFVLHVFLVHSIHHYLLFPSSDRLSDFFVQMLLHRLLMLSIKIQLQLQRRSLVHLQTFCKLLRTDQHLASIALVAYLRTQCWF